VLDKLLTEFSTRGAYHLHLIIFRSYPFLNKRKTSFFFQKAKRLDFTHHREKKVSLTQNKRKTVFFRLLILKKIVSLGR